MIQRMERVQTILEQQLFADSLAQLEQREHRRIYCRHGLPHLLDVARIASILAADHALDCPRDVIYAAALLHDIGRLEQYATGEPHTSAGVALARKILCDTTYTQEEQREILEAVGGHQTGGDGHALTRLICEADHASRLCFSCAARDTCNWPETRRNQTILL